MVFHAPYEKKFIIIKKTYDFARNSDLRSGNDELINAFFSRVKLKNNLLFPWNYNTNRNNI